MGNKPAKKVADPVNNKAEKVVEKKNSDNLDEQIWRDRETDSELIKLLLLGAGESGKSTLFKQMIRLYGQGFSGKDLVLHIPMIHNNTVGAIKELCLQSEIIGRVDNKCLIDDGAQASKHFVDDLKLEDKVTPEAAEHIIKLWKDPGIQHTYTLRSRFQLVDSAAYFFESARRIAEVNYTPTEEDLIRCRVRTTGIVEHRFVIDDNKFLMVDVGGQRNERKKWIHCFEGVTAVIFVAALSEYDQVLYEDGQTNRMTEALKLFEETCRLKWFVDTAAILFLNKRDLFQEKIKVTPLLLCFPEYVGDGSYDSSVDFIRKKFEEKSHLKKLYVHVTCATDSNNVAAVFGAVKDIIIQRHLQESGLI